MALNLASLMGYNSYGNYNNWSSYLSPILQGLQSGYTNQYNNYGLTGVSSNSFANALYQASAAQNAQSSLNVPVSMDSIFEEAARTYNVSANLLKAIGKAESDFNPNDVSGAGAVGVMQLMPETARELGVADPYDVRQNIMGGAKYISQMLARYNGNVDLALAAYNAGPGAVDKYGGIPPYSETQNYVRKVKEYMGMDLTTGQTVNTSANTVNGLNGNMLGTGCCACCQNSSLYGTAATQEDALYLIELMKLQMQSNLGNFLTGNSNDSGSGWL